MRGDLILLVAEVTSRIGGIGDIGGIGSNNRDTAFNTHTVRSLSDSLSIACKV